MKNLFLSALIIVSSLNVAQAVPLDVGTWNGSGCCNGLTRGYWFTAPTDFTINSLSVPTNGSGGDATLEVLRLNSPPPLYSSTTNDFTQLGFWSGNTSIQTNISVGSGDVIGILGYANGMTPYGSSNYATNLGGFDITLRRFGFQGTGAASNVWTESSGSIGIIGMDYTVGSNQVPEPATTALIGLGLLGFLASRRKSGKSKNA